MHSARREPLGRTINFIMKGFLNFSSSWLEATPTDRTMLVGAASSRDIQQITNNE